MRAKERVTSRPRPCACSARAPRRYGNACVVWAMSPCRSFCALIWTTSEIRFSVFFHRRAARCSRASCKRASHFDVAVRISPACSKYNSSQTKIALFHLWIARVGWGGQAFLLSAAAFRSRRTFHVKLWAPYLQGHESDCSSLCTPVVEYRCFESVCTSCQSYCGGENTSPGICIGVRRPNIFEQYRRIRWGINVEDNSPGPHKITFPIQSDFDIHAASRNDSVRQRRDVRDPTSARIPPDAAKRAPWIFWLPGHNIFFIRRKRAPCHCREEKDRAQKSHSRNDPAKGS